MRSDHFDGKRFFNPGGAAPPSLWAVARMLREPRSRWPLRVEQRSRQPLPLGDAAAMVTFIGHSTLLIQTAAGNVLTDPVYADRAGPAGLLGPRRVRGPAVRMNDLPPVGIVLLSHNHYDHCDLRALGELARRFDPMVVTPLGNGRLVRSTGIRRVVELDWWQETVFQGLSIASTPARHFSARGVLDRNRALWGGFVITCGPTRIFFAGDTAYGPFFTEIRERLGPMTLALLPIGAYEPRWFMHVVHMNPAEAVQAHLDLDAPQSIGMHFGTFQLTSEGIDEPLRALEQACRDRHVPSAGFRTLDFGESFRLP